MQKHFFSVYREQHKLTQAELAQKLGVSRALVGLIESGDRSISAERAHAWAATLGVERRLLNPIFDVERVN